MEQKLVRGKKELSLDFKKDFGKLRSLILNADVLLDPYRPGVLEAIGLDPVKLLEENEKLIVARVTGYGQTGSLAKVAGHDINYVALSGSFFRFETMNENDFQVFYPQLRGTIEHRFGHRRICSPISLAEV